MNRKLFALIFVLIVLTNCKERSFNNPVDPDNINMNLPAPSDLSIAIVDVNVLKLNWNDNCEYEDAYRIERSIGTGSFSEIAKLSANSTEWSDSTVALGNLYHYRISTLHENYSSIHTSSSYNYRLLAPTLNNPEQIDETHFRISWQNDNHFAEGIAIDMKQGDADWQENVAIVNDGDEWVYENTIMDSPTLYWRAKAYYKSLQSPLSNETSIIPFSVAEPSFDPTPGDYSNPQSVEISCATIAANIRYTTDGNEPHEYSALYSSAVDITQNTTLKAKAYKAGWSASATATANYTLIVSAPIISLPSGDYDTEQKVKLSCSTQTAQIRYTTDGSEPSETSALYSSALDITQNTTLKAKAYKAGWSASVTTTASYTFTVADPIISLPTGNHYTEQKVKISSTTIDAQIRYTTDDSEPNESSTLYSSTLDITQNTTLKAKAYKAGWTASAIATATYTLIVSTPVISVPSGIYDSPFDTEISCSTPGAQIRYTANGSEPLETSMLYTDPISLYSNTTLKAKAFKVGWNASSIETAEYVISFVFVQGGTFNNGTSDVTLSSFLIDKYEVTQAAYEAVMGTNPSYFAGNPNRPVERVSWFNAIEFCNRRSMQEGLTPCYSYGTYGTNPDTWPNGWNTNNTNHRNVICSWNANGYRLPTEMEWMFAAKGGNGSQGYTYSGSNDINAVAWYSSNSSNATHDVGELTANECGIFDMSGNVWEWCWDIYGNYPSASQTNPTGATSGYYRVSRGGGWSYSASFCTVSYRDNLSNATFSYYNVGFRLCRISP